MFIQKSIAPPNLFIIGAPKAGTSALADLLTRHDCVFCDEKEPRFFDAPVYFDFPTDYPISSEREYLQLFQSKKAQKAKYRLDASTFIMYRPEAVDHILSLSPSARFIVILRDPIDASKSMFRQRLKYASEEMREISDQFDECWAAIESRRNGFGFPTGCRNTILFQYDQLYSYEKYLPVLQSKILSNHLMILKYEDFLSQPDEVLYVIGEFLNLTLTDLGGLKNVNPPYPVRRTRITEAKEKILRAVLAKSRVHRRRIGLYGKRVNFVKSLLRGRACSPNDSVEIATVGTTVSMRNTFASTYDYLDTLQNFGSEGKLNAESDKK